MTDFNTTAAPPPPPTGAPSQEDRTMALLTHLSGILFGFLVPLVIWLINKDKPDKAFLTDQAKEALNFQLTALIAFLICLVLSFVLIGMVLFPLVWLAVVVFSILAGVKANEGVAYRYPVTLRLIR